MNITQKRNYIIDVLWYSIDDMNNTTEEDVDLIIHNEGSLSDCITFNS